MKNEQVVRGRPIAVAAAVALAAFVVFAAGWGGSTLRAGTAQPDADSSPRVPGKEWREFAVWVSKRAAAGKFSGAVLIAKDGKPVVEQANGLADRRRRRPNSLATEFNIGSVGKSFTAVAIAQLVEAGKLSFDDTVGKYLSGFPAQVANQVTIGQLLTHTSGLGDVFMRWRAPARAQLDLADLVTRIAKEPLQFQPGSRFGYSNSGYVVLGAIVEAVTGQNYYDYVRTHVFRPAGMARTGWYAVDEVPNLA